MVPSSNQREKLPLLRLVSQSLLARWNDQKFVTIGRDSNSACFGRKASVIQINKIHYSVWCFSKSLIWSKHFPIIVNCGGNNSGKNTIQEGNDDRKK